jgi:hypothetical protein
MNRYLRLPTSVFSLLLLISAISNAKQPPAPTELVAVPESASSFLIGWADTSDNETGFRIERRLLKGDWRLEGVAPKNGTSFISTGCQAYTEYEHRVIAFNEDGESVSEPVAGTTLALLNQRRGRVIEASNARQSEGAFIKLKNGDLELYYSDMVTVSDQAEARITKKVSSDGGETWGGPEVVFVEKGMALFLPSLGRMGNGNIAISYARRVPGEWNSKRVVRISKDEGQNWGDEILVSDSVHNYQTGSHDRFYRLSNDDLIILIHSVEGDPGRPRHLVTDVYGSTDHGRSWKRWTKESLDVPVNPYEQGEYGYWECAIAELGGGEILMYGRNASGWIYESRSKDSGRTWSIPEQTNIRNPLAPPYLKRIPGTSTLMLLSTTMLSPRGRLMGDRNVLASRISEDGGVTWKNHKEIEYHTHDLWYDYPNVLFDGDFVHLSYRMIELKPDKGWDRVNLGYLKLPIVWFTE